MSRVATEGSVSGSRLVTQNMLLGLESGWMIGRGAGGVAAAKKSFGENRAQQMGTEPPRSSHTKFGFDKTVSHPQVVGGNRLPVDHPQ